MKCVFAHLYISIQFALPVLPYLFVYYFEKKVPHYYTEIIYLKNTNTPARAKQLASFSFGCLWMF